MLITAAVLIGVWALFSSDLLLRGRAVNLLVCDATCTAEHKLLTSDVSEYNYYCNNSVEEEEKAPASSEKSSEKRSSEKSSEKASSEKREGSHMIKRIASDTHGGEGVSYVPPNYSHVVIFLHGLGDSGAGWEDLAKMAQSHSQQFAARTKFIFPTASVVPVTLNMGMTMNAWADIIAIDAQAPEDIAGYTNSMARIRRMVEAEAKVVGGADRIVLGGFSQGGAVAYVTMFHQDYPAELRLAGVVLLSTWMPTLARNAVDAAHTTRAFVGHGDSDTVVPLQWGLESAKFAQSKGLDITLRKYRNMAHSACSAEFADVLEFLDKCLTPASA